MASAEALLRGETRRCCRRWRHRMLGHAERLSSRAALVRNQIQALARAAPAGRGYGGEQRWDILAVRVQGGRAASTWPWCGRPPSGRSCLFPLTNRRRYSHFSPESAPEDGAALPSVAQQVLAAFVAQHYVAVPVPPLLLLTEVVEPACCRPCRQSGQRVQAMYQPHGQRRLAGDGAAQRRFAVAARLAGRGGSQQARTRAPGRGAGAAGRCAESLFIECLTFLTRRGEAPARRA